MAAAADFDHEAFKQFESSGYSKVAEGYSRVTVKVTSQVNEPMLNAVGVQAGTQLLDIACGPGMLGAAAVKRGAVVTGLDMAENMVSFARSQCPEAEFHHGDAENLPFDAARFDAVVCSFGILHFPDPERAIAEVFRVLKPAGRYAFTCWCPPERNPFFSLILGSIQTHGTMNVDVPPGPPLFRFGDPAECERALKIGGFELESVSEIPIVWTVSRPEDLVGEVKGSTARIGPILSLQTEEQRREIENAITEGARAYRKKGGVEIPAPAVLASARKP